MQHQHHRWIASVYLMQGLPYALVMAVSPVFYKNFGLDNATIAFVTSLFALPWTIKFFIAPALERIIFRKNFIVIMQLLIASIVLLMSITLWFTLNWIVIGWLFLSIAILSAMHDIQADGFYLAALLPQQQANFVGIRTVFYQLGKLLVQGGLLFSVGYLTSQFTLVVTWMSTMGVLAIVVVLLAWISWHTLPSINETILSRSRDKKLITSYQEVFTALLRLPHLWPMIIFLLLYPLPEAQLTKILPLFMLDHVEQGGLNLNVTTVGIIYGGIGLVSMLLGVTFSGYLLNRLSLKKCLLPFTLVAAILNISYFMMSFSSSITIWQIGLLVMLAQFGFGLCNGAYMLYIITAFARGNYAMSLYAIGTTIMLVAMVVGGMMSGYLQSYLGYTYFFAWIVLLSFMIVPLAFYQLKRIL